MDHKKLLEQIDEWYNNDEDQKIVDAILEIPAKDRGYDLIGQLAVAYNNTEKYDEAIQILFSVAEEGKADHEWYYRLGYAYSELEKYEEAISNFSEAIKLDPEYEPAYTSRGDAYNELGKHEEAVLDYNKASKLDSENQEGSNGIGSFLSFVLLDESALDLDLLRKQLQEDWGIVINKNSEENDDSQSLIETINDMNLIVSLMPAPIPNDEALDNAKTNFYWEEAVDVTKSHKAHILVSVLGGEKDLLGATDLFVKVCTSCLKQPNAIAINTLGTVLQPEFYIEYAESSLNNNEFPLMNMVFFGIYSNDNGATMSLYTYGLGAYGKLNMEIIDSDKAVDETLGLLQSIVEYVITSDVTLKAGETIGMSEEQKLKITALDSDVLGEESLQIDF